MSKRRRFQKSTQELREAFVESLSHDGRGVARVNEKATFICGALPGERVKYRTTSTRRSFDVGEVVEVLTASPDRVVPKCQHFGICGGCSLQHLQESKQIEEKQRILLDNLSRIGKVEPSEIWEPLRGDCWGYRRKARIGVKFVIKKGRLLVGFREQLKPYIADLQSCEVLVPAVGQRLQALAAVIASLSIFDAIAQVEVAAGDQITALVFRHLKPCSDADIELLRSFGNDHNFAIYLQPAGPASIHCISEPVPLLTYQFSDGQVGADPIVFEFEPTDFIQVNADLNQKMIRRALELLDVQPQERLLDLFCGLGNFSLPLARRAAHLVGVEGEVALIHKARANAARNQIQNVEFHVADLSQELTNAAWAKGEYDKVLIDPARPGALEILPLLKKMRPKKLLYISCNPSTLARDAGVLVNEMGFRLAGAGVMDMFPHTAHVESMALFLPGSRKL